MKPTNLNLLWKANFKFVSSKIAVLLLFFTGMANAQIVSIPDANFKAVLLSASPTMQIATDFNNNYIKIDTNDDGEIQETEAQSVKTLLINQPLMLNSTGIDSFSNLESLTFIECSLTSLDVTALSNLKSLSCLSMPTFTSLNVNNNIGLTSLSVVNVINLATLNVSNLSNLSKLSIYRSGLTSFNANGLVSLTELFYFANPYSTTLTVNGLTNLTKLICSQNSLSVLNLSGLTSLTELDCSGNQLTNLNGVPNINKLNCEYNKLTNLNFNGLTNLTELRCGGNELTSLNVNTLTNLTTLSCFSNKIATLNLSGLPNLTNFECSNNRELTSVTLSNLPLLQEFTYFGGSTMYAEVLGVLTNLSLSGLPNLHKLTCSYGKLESLNVSNLPNLTELYCSANQITNITLGNLPNLQKLDCTRNRISTLDASGLSGLIELTCGNSYLDAGQSVPPFLTNLNVTGLANLKILNCSSNALSALDLTGLNNLEILYCNGIIGAGHITSLAVNHLTNLKKFMCSYQELTSLDVSNMPNLSELHCDHNNISSLNLTGLPNLKVLDYTYNQLANLSLVNLPSLEYLFCSHNQLQTLNVLNLTSLNTLWCTNNQLTTLNLSGLSNLVSLDISYNNLALANISGLSNNLGYLACMSNNLTSLDVSGLPNLSALHCQDNALTSLDVSTLSNLRYLTCYDNQLSNLNLGSLPLLETVNCSNNQLTTIDLSGLTALYGFDCSNNQLTFLDLSNHANFTGLNYSYNAIPNLDLHLVPNLKSLSLESTGTSTLDVTFMHDLESLECSRNQLTSIDISNAPNLQYLSCMLNELQTIDVSTASKLQLLRCNNNNPLTSIFMKNGADEFNIEIYANPNLQYICADESQLEQIQALLNSDGLTGTVCNSYCSFTPGGNHNTITGITIFDANNDGCDVTDVVNPFIRLNINDTAVDGATVTNINGTYNFYTNAGNYTITPNTENPTWFNFSPTSANFSFTDNNNNIATQNFCINAVGTHKDVEVIFTPLEAARPGFDAKYKIVFKNKGNQMQSGTVNLQFDDARTNFITASPTADATATNVLSWNYTNLMPFENRSIIVTFTINPPTETVETPVNNGDVLDFTASVPVTGDELSSDNQFHYQQLVVGSLDPNEITCLEGDTVSPTEIGDYLHYMINFENTGTYYAENVVVRLEIDDTKFDMNSLQMLNSSNPSSTRISGNVVEFVLQDINLAAASGNPPVGGHGDVLFKIKTKDNLPVNDTVLQRAGIYFDYNFPVNTNEATTTFAELSNNVPEFNDAVKIYPNPAKSIINIVSDFEINSIELYDVQGRILETIIENGSATKLDISAKSNGIYFLKIKTDKGSKVEKIIKE